MQAFRFCDNEDMLAELTDSRDEHDTEASEYGKLVSYSKGTKKRSRHNVNIIHLYSIIKLKMYTQISMMKWVDSVEMYYFQHIVF